MNLKEQVLNTLSSAPYIGAREIAERHSLTVEELNHAYKAIQTSEECQKRLLKSINRDYFETVREYFGKELYTVIFFVGLGCPYRCPFCPSVTIEKDGYRKLAKFRKRPGDRKLEYRDFEKIFADIEQMQKKGIIVEVKISGGLEPYTDPETVNWILELASRQNVDSTIFTNGVLLRDPKNREIALKSDKLRISLGTVSEEAYADEYFGEHPRNKRSNSLGELQKTIRQLVQDRNNSGAATAIGMNTVVGEFNFHELEQVVLDAHDFGVDYIAIKSDYFKQKDDEWFDKVETATAAISGHTRDGKIGNMRVILTGSQERSSFLNSSLQGKCLPIDQAMRQMFIDPFGQCTPVHCWAFPVQEKEQERHTTSLNEHTGLQKIIEKTNDFPLIDYSKLNPFELIISLESERQRQDLAFGVERDCNPYISPHNVRNPDSLNFRSFCNY